MTERTDMVAWTCPLPLRNYPTIVMSHGSGGKMMSDLINHLFLPLFNNPILARLGDSAVLELPLDGGERLRLAYSTDSFVVSPLIFPGGDIGELAVNGTINDLAMSGARPLFLSAGFILEEGLPMDMLGLIANSVSRACNVAGVKLVTGDTKVVDKGHGDGLFINTSGIGLVPDSVDIAPDRARPGDSVIVSGTVGDHGIAIMSVREGLGFESRVKSDTSPLNSLVDVMLGVTRDIHCLRDATRGGLAATLNELTSSSGIGLEFSEQEVPIKPAVQAACDMLGLDPFHLANEGKLVAVLPQETAETVLASMRDHPLGKDAAIIGRVVDDHPGLVVAHTAIGGTRIVDLPSGELLPRIC